MEPVLAIVDGFAPDADALRERALALPFRRPEGVNYPGVEAAAAFAAEGVIERVAQLLGGTPLRWRGQPGAVRLTTAADAAERTSLVHADAPDFTAILHLSAAPAEGTYFYRHRALNIARIDPGAPWLPFVRQAAARDTLDLSAWEVTRLVPARFNRLVLFDGKFFHSGAQSLTGADAAEGRLTCNYFFDRV